MPDSKSGLLPLHSPLLGQSQLLSFPPLTDMLKFSGYPYPIRGRTKEVWVSRRAAPGDQCECILLRRGRRRCCRRCSAGRAALESGTRWPKAGAPPTPSRALGGSRVSKRRSDGHGRRITGGRKVRSKIRWFTEFCNSHYVSHFAAFFIDARAKRSIVESFFIFV